MNNFAGTLTFSGEINTDKIQEKYLIIKPEESEEISIFLFGKTKLETSDEIIQSYSHIGTLEAYDISISTEDNMSLLNNEIDKEGLYEVASFESPVMDIRNIVDRFQDSFEIICVREAEESEKFGNRIVKVDFIY